MTGKIIDAAFSPISLVVGDKVGHAITGAAMVAAGIYTGNLQLAVAGIGLASSSLTKKSKVSPATKDRLQASFDTDALRKIVFGQTALATDVRYQAFTGSNQEYVEQIVCVASHQVESIDEIWFDNEKAWTKAGGAQGRFAGFLTVTDRLVGTSSNGIAIDSVWTSSCTLTGCAYVHIKYKLTGNSKKADSPFASSIPSRMTIRGKGALVYDPRLDSTVPGGSGAQRADDQTTWAWSVSGSAAGRNPALQELWYKLGWRIRNPLTGAWKLAVGKGIPPAREDLASYITAANICDESVALAAGGTERRYRSDGIFSEGDDPSAVLTALNVTMNGALRDAGGRLSLSILKNDLASPILAFTEADVLRDELWEQTPDITGFFNVVRGRYVDASDAALYQLTDYPEVRFASLDGIDRIDSFDLGLVQSASQAQRLAKTRLQRNQYQGRYTAKFGPRAWAVSIGDVVTLSHVGLGWTSKLFRVAAQTMEMTGAVTLHLQEENAAIYAWSAEENPAVVPAAPTIYNPSNNPIVAALLTVDTTLIANSYTSGLSGNVTQVDAGSSVTVTIPNHTRVYPAPQAAASVTGTTLTGLAYSTIYLFYYDDPDLAGGAVTYHATTIEADAYYSATNPARHFVCFVETVASGGGGGDTGGSGPGGSGGWKGGTGGGVIP